MSYGVLAERFAREREILARLVHPNIARLYDAGFAADGQAYLAIEYVEGVPFTQSCDERRLSVDARIALFLQVLSAVQYAHNNLVLHRDLKPSNILVTPEGHVKLLDFGIAKLLASDGSAEETEITRLGGHALTIDYAAPEQVTGAPLTTAVDVYALGVLLYELLTGARPYRLEHGTLERYRGGDRKRRPGAAVGSGVQRRGPLVAVDVAGTPSPCALGRPRHHRGKGDAQGAGGTLCKRRIAGRRPHKASRRPAGDGAAGVGLVPCGETLGEAQLAGCCTTVETLRSRSAMRTGVGLAGPM